MHRHWTIGQTAWRLGGGAALAALFIAQLTITSDTAQAVGLVYVDADDGLNGPGNLTPLSNINLIGPDGDDGLWSYRGDGGVVGPGAVFRSVYEASGGTTAVDVEDAAQIAQTLTGLAANTSYDVYVAYWQGASAGFDWNVRAGFTPGSLQLFNTKGPTEVAPDGIAGAVAGYHKWDAAPLSTAGVAMFTEAGRTLLLGKVGTTNSSAGGQISVTIDDLPANIPGAGTNGNRSWFDGLAYAPAGTTVFVAPGDLNASGTVTPVDAGIFRTNLHTDTTGLQLTDTYPKGDLNLDGLINHTDFVRFKTIYNAANGVGSLEAYLASVPEPSTYLLAVAMAACATVLLLSRRNNQRRWAIQKVVSMASTRKICMTLAGCLVAVSAQAAPVTNWLAVNSQTPFGATTKPTSALNTNSPVIGDGSDGSAGQVALYADINGTLNGAPDVSLANGQKVTFSGMVTLTGITSSMEQFRWGLFNDDASPFDPVAWTGYFATNSATTTGGALRAKDVTNSAFASSLFVANGGTVNLQSVADGDAFNAGAYQFSMTASRIGEDLTIDATLTDGANFTQQWNDLVVTDPNQRTFNFNRVGFLLGNAMSPDQVTFSNIDVSVDTVDALFLQVTTTGPNAGKMRIVNPTGDNVDIDYYEITSAAGSLNVVGWTSLDDQEGGDPETQGWDEAGGADANILSEIRFDGATTISSGGILNLGSGFNAAMALDLVFSVGLPGSENLVRGIVQYGVPVAPGDFDANGVINNADLSRWAGDLGANGMSDGDGDGDSDGFDFLIWQRNRGAVSAEVVAAAVPEPGAICLAGLGSVLLILGARRRR